MERSDSASDLTVSGVTSRQPVLLTVVNSSESIDPASLLELESADKVLVITRLSTTQMQAITPLNGALVYNTDESCLFYYNGQIWINLCDALGLSFTNEAIVNQDTPIIITEFGPPGTWEIPLTDFGAPPELTSTEKAAFYRESYQRAITEAPGLALGSYAFLWGNKMEATSKLERGHLVRKRARSPRSQGFHAYPLSPVTCSLFSSIVPLYPGGL